MVVHSAVALVEYLVVRPSSIGTGDDGHISRWASCA